MSSPNGMPESLPVNGLGNEAREIVESSLQDVYGSSKRTFLDAARHLSKPGIRGEIVVYGVWRG